MGQAAYDYNAVRRRKAPQTQRKADLRVAKGGKRRLSPLQAAVHNAMHLVGMDSYAEKTMDKMSDGECQRIMIARALAQDTPVILLDEPTAFLDLPNRYELCLLLRKLTQKEGKCILFSTHDLDIALSLCDTIMLIDNPQLYSLPTNEMITSGHIERLFHNESITFDAQAMKIRIR